MSEQSDMEEQVERGKKVDGCPGCEEAERLSRIGESIIDHGKEIVVRQETEITTLREEVQRLKAPYPPMSLDAAAQRVLDALFDNHHERPRTLDEFGALHRLLSTALYNHRKKAKGAAS